MGAAAGIHVVLSNSFATPHIFSDELIYSSLGKGIATGSGLVIRGGASSGYGVGYPLFIAPAYALAADGARAFEAIQALNSVVMAAAAVPVYFLARRVLGGGWSLGAAALTVVAPWMGYSALVMTEPLFTFVFLLFCLTLVRALETPTATRQLMCVVCLAGLCTVRIQGIVLAPAIAAAVLLAAPAGERTAFARKFGPTWLALAALALTGLMISGGDVTGVLGAYDVLIEETRIIGTPIWAAKNIAAIELGVGILALALLPRALISFLGRSAGREERALGAVTLSCLVALLVSVAVLSASPYGLDRVHERNLFYIVPLLVTCVLGWAGKRPSDTGGVGAALGGVAVVLFPLALVTSDFEDASQFDAPSLERWQQLATWFPDPRLPFVGAAAVALAVAFRRPSRLTISVVTVVAFVTVTPSLFYDAPITRSDARELAWVDRAIPAGSQALLLWPEPTPTGCGTTRDIGQLALWTEFFNVSVARVARTSHNGSAGGLAAAEIDISKAGHLMRDGARVFEEYIVAESRYTVHGTRIADLPLTSGGSNTSQPAALTLWRSRQPVRIDVEAPPSACNGG